MEKQPFRIIIHHALDEDSMFNVNKYSDYPRIFVKVMMDTQYTADWADAEDQWQRDYARDVLGTSPSQFSSGYRNRIVKMGMRFSNLQDSGPVQLVSEKDEICSACAIGNHCNQPGTKEHDIDYSNRFIWAAERLKKQEEVDFSMTRNEEGGVTQIDTTKQTLVEILGLLEAYRDWPIFLFREQWRKRLRPS